MSKKSAQDNRANQLNPTHPAYHQSRGAAPDQAQRMAANSRPTADNRANQLNPNNVAHQASRDEGSSTTSNAASKKSFHAASAAEISE